MTTVAESTGAASALNAAQLAGTEALSQSQTIEFLEYSRQVLPLDGFIFWLKTGRSLTAAGSFHVAKTLEQREDETLGVSRVVFTAEQQIQDFDTLQPGTMYIGSIGRNPVRLFQQQEFLHAGRAVSLHGRGDISGDGHADH